MKIRHYRAADMRSALAQVRDALGPDAIILSSRRNGSEVEVVAAIDDPRTVKLDIPPVPSASTPSKPAAQSMSSDALAQEMRSLRQILETRLPGVAAAGVRRDLAICDSLFDELTKLGLARDIVAQLIDQLPPQTDLANAVPAAISLLTSQIPVVDERWQEHGGRLLFVGPSGVGKTTLLAKLAARWVLQNGPERVALVSADTSRIGAQDQLRVIGRLLGVRTECLTDVGGLGSAMTALRDYRLVLIDTSGTHAATTAAAQSLAKALAVDARIETVLVVAANSQAAGIDDLFARSKWLQPCACVITKLDEAASLGGVLSAAVRSKLPIASVSSGPEIPDDLAPARPAALVARAQRLLRERSTDLQVATDAAA